jgi:uncharacterized protein with PIN domain
VITRDKVLEAVERFKRCQKCIKKPTLFIEYEGLVISGCDKHMVKLGELLRSTGYYTKYQNVDEKSESDN